jgi:hypothetical protein
MSHSSTKEKPSLRHILFEGAFVTLVNAWIGPQGRVPASFLTFSKSSLTAFVAKLFPWYLYFKFYIHTLFILVHNSFIIKVNKETLGEFPNLSP